MKSMFFKTLRLLGAPSLFRYLFQRKNVSILTYHEISPKTAELHFSFLSKRYHFISLQQLIEALHAQKMHTLPDYSMVIVFDDGHKSNYELLPVLKKFKIPATIFLNSGIVCTKRHYWFKFSQSKYSLEYLKTLPYKEKWAILKEVGYEKDKEFESRQALSRAEIEELCLWIDMQSHTVSHPILPNCTDEEAVHEITNCKKILERQYGLTINAIAYPNGDYSDRDIEICRNAGYKAGLTTELGFNSNKTNPFKIKRLDSNDTSDFNEFIVKSSGAILLLKPKHFFKAILDN